MRIKRIPLLLYNAIITSFQIILLLFKKVQYGPAKVIIRFDDYGVWCNSDWIAIEEEVIRLHEKYGVKISFGVIPDSKYPLIAHPLSPSVYPKEYENLENNPNPLVEGCKRVEILKDSVKKGIAEVALHGYTHPKGYSNKINTEFMGLPYDMQYQKLQQGKKLLEKLFDSEVSTFIPPHNTYDNLTIDLLYDFGFKCVSGGYPGVNSPRCDSLNLSFLWFKYDSFSKLSYFLENKDHYKYEPINILMLHHTNFTREGKIDKERIIKYEKFLKNIAENNIVNYCFSDVPDSEVKNFDTTYYQEKDNILLRTLRKIWPAIANNYIEYKLKKQA